MHFMRSMRMCGSVPDACGLKMSIHIVPHFWPEGAPFFVHFNATLGLFYPFLGHKKSLVGLDNSADPLSPFSCKVGLQKMFTQFCDAIPVPGHSRE